MSCPWWFPLALEAVGVQPAGGACEEDYRDLALSEGADVHVRRYCCGIGSSHQTVATCRAVVECTVVLFPDLAKALVSGSV